MRRISQPAREVKLLQRALMLVLLERLPIHPSATAYRRGVSLLDNVKPHAGSGRPILKLDFREFFPSIRSTDWTAYCREFVSDFSEEDVRLTAHLLFQKRDSLMRLAIGAPSSPMLSNILLFHFDTMVADAVAKDKVIYTRYADDMTFSAARTGYLTGVIKTVVTIIRKMRTPRLELNVDKTVYATAKYQRSVTGLVLSNQGDVTIGRDSKREIRAAVHHASENRLNEDQLRVLAGKLAYINSVEVSFLDVLRKKYGDSVIDMIRRNVSTGNR